MRLNKFIALATGLSRRTADTAIAEGRVAVNNQPAKMGQPISDGDTVTLDGKQLHALAKKTIILNKPTGYVCSRNGQGNRTIYELLPTELHNLKPVGRLDKDSSGLLVLTNDGEQAQELAHPSRHKQKVYEVLLDKPLAPLHRQMIQDHGITLYDGVSKLRISRLDDNNDTRWQITMHEGRNRQVRRTFAALGYEVTRLHRTQFGPWQLTHLASGKYAQL